MNNTLSPSPREKILNLVETVRLAAEADSPQNPAAHAKLLTAIRKLQIAAETPMESILSLLFLVCIPAPKSRDGLKSFHMEVGGGAK